MTKTTIKRLMTIVSFALAGVLVIQLIELFGFRRAQDEAARAQAAAISEAFKGELTTLLDRVESQAESLGARFGSEDLSADSVTEILAEASRAMPEIRGITACYEPFAFTADRRLFCPYYNKASGELVYVEDGYDYTTRADGTLWYGNVIDDGPNWAEPYYGSAVGEWFIDYGVPFAFSAPVPDGLDARPGETRGIIDYSLGVSDFQSIVHGLSVGKSNESFIVTSGGNFVYHPVASSIGTETVESYTARPDTAVGVRDALMAVMSGGTGSLDYVSADGGDAIAIYDRIPGADYGVVSTFLRRDLLNDEKAAHRRYIRISLIFSLLLIIASIRYFARDELDRGEIEGLSITTAVILLANVIFIGALQHSLSTTRSASESLPILDTASLNALIDTELERADALKVTPPIAVPTGLFIERMAFADSYNVDLGGVIWQKYPLSLFEGEEQIETGIRLPQMSPFAEASYIEEAYRTDVPAKEGEEGYRLIGYDFRVTLRLNLSYRDFPFDKRHLDIQITPASRTDAVMLVPDLSGYTSTNPTELAGLSDDIALPGNRLVESYFNFTFDDFDTDFGFDAAGLNDHVPSLHFNIHQKRYLLNAFVTYLIPIGVTLAMIYILILATEKTSERQGIIESMAAFFFVLIFSHIDLRKDVVTADLIFIEYFYFITYGMIILATFNLITYSKSRVGYFDYNENQIFRAIFFPVFLTLLLAVMLMRFY